MAGITPPPALSAEQQDTAPALPAPSARVAGITEGPLRPAIFALAWPAVGTTLFQVLFNVTDTFWVGRTLGPAALAGVSVASYAVWIMTSIGELVGVGLTAVAARRHGERNPAAAARAAGTALWMALGLGLLVAASGIALLGPLFGVMQASAEVSQYGREFLTVQLVGAALVYGYFVVAAAFRSSGDTRTPFYLLGTAVLVNLVLDPIMILGLGPMPALGVYGAALATVFTRGLGFAVGLAILIRRRAIRNGFEWGIARTIARIGLPMTLTGVLFSLIYIWLARVTAAFGTPALAALGIGHRVEGISYMTCVGFALAAETMVGQNLGAGRPDRARRAGWTTVRIAGVPTIAFAILFLLVPGRLAAVFTDDPATVAAAASYLRVVAVAQIAIAFEQVFEGALGGAGYTIWPMVWVVALSAIRIPLAPWAAAQWGLTAIWWVLTLTAVGRAVALTALWHRGAWDRSRV